MDVDRFAQSFVSVVSLDKSRGSPFFSASITSCWRHARGVKRAMLTDSLRTSSWSDVNSVGKRKPESTLCAVIVIAESVVTSLIGNGSASSESVSPCHCNSGQGVVVIVLFGTLRCVMLSVPEILTR